MRNRLIYKRFKQAVGTQGMNAGDVEALPLDVLRSMAGSGGEGRTNTFFENMKRKLAAVLRQREVKTAAQWIESRIQTQFPQAETRVRRGRVIEVWLDGLPEEAE